MANEALAIVILEVAERHRNRTDAEVESLRRYLQAELYRAALPKAA
jgi:hypothetical protein